MLSKDGVYASLVNIQTSLRRGVRQLQAAGTLIGAATNGGLGLASEDVGSDASLFDSDGDDADATSEPPSVDAAKYRPNWLDPSTASLHWDDAQGLCLDNGDRRESGLHAMYAFPATHPEEFISLRKRDPLGGDEELGLVRSIADWPETARDALRRALDRRYLLRRIESIQLLRTAGDRLEFVVETDSGPTTFRIDPRGDGLQPYGRNGRLLVDVLQNFFVIPDLGALPRRQRQLLSLYLGT